MSKPVETRVLGTLDEVLYGEIPNTALYSDRQEFHEAQNIFKKSEIGKEFGGTVYWLEWMLPQVEAEVKRANDSLHAYHGSNPERLARLVQDARSADFLMSFLKGLVEDAKSFPRPVFQKEQQ